MKRVMLFLLLPAIAASPYVIVAAPSTHHTFEKVQLSDEFFSEGANIGDFNNDGTADIVSGPYWYEGPDFGTRHEIYPPQPFDLLEFSNCFLMFVDDLNDDGWDDVVRVGFPGEEAHWFENPQGEGDHWDRHLIRESVGNESPAWTDIDGDGRPELVMNTGSHLGYARADWDDPAAPWEFVPVSPEGDWGRFTHGLGYGDVNGNGRVDLITRNGWWEHPQSLEGDPEWAFHPVEIGPGAQMYVYDVDGDGRNDLISSLNAHGWGLAWFRQGESDSGEATFSRHLIMGERYRDNRYGVRFSQPHAVALVDIDNSGTKDIVTGKRLWGHGPDGDPEPNAPAVLYWFKTVRNDEGEIDFLPFEIDDTAGIGTQLTTGDLSGNGYPDIVSANKNGTFLFLNRPVEITPEEWEEARPKVIPFHRQ